MHRTLTVSSVPAPVTIGATGLAQLAQEIRMVLATRKGSLPLDRDFGVDWSLVDNPENTLLPLAVAEVAQAIEANVPRVTVRSVSFERSNAIDGEVIPKAVCRIREEYLKDFENEQYI